MAQQIGNEPLFLSLLQKGATADGDMLMELIREGANNDHPKKKYFSSRCSAALIGAGYNLEARDDGSSPLAAAVEVQDWYVPSAVLSRIAHYLCRSVVTALVTNLSCELPEMMPTEVKRHLEWKNFADYVARPTPNQLLYFQKVS